LTCLRQLILEQEAKNHTTKSRKELFEDAIRMIETKSFEDQKKYVQEKVNEQVRTQFETLLQVLPFMQKQEDIHTKNYSVSGFAYQVDKKHTPTQIFQEKLGYSLHV
jgi:exopolysaccharide biosynthesis protein